jgi:glutaredoxin 3
MAMQYLASKGVKFTEKDITQDRDALNWVADNVGQLATPVIDIDGTTILGFDRDRIDAALRAKKLTQ